MLAAGVLSRRTSIERGPSAATSVFFNTTLASSALVNRPRRRSLDDLLGNEKDKPDVANSNSEATERVAVLCTMNR